MNENLQHLLDGGKLERPSGAIVEFEGIEITHEDNSLDSLTLAEVEECEIHLSPEDVEIRDLKLKVKNLELKLNEIINPSKSPTSNNNFHTKPHVHLTIPEIVEIEQMFTMKPLSNIDLIASTYNVTRNVIVRIQRGKHTKSSPSYKAKLTTNQG